MKSQFLIYGTPISFAHSACSMTETNIQQLLLLSEQSNFKNHYKLILYEKLQVLKENVEKMKKEIDDAYKQIEEEIKKLPIE